MVSSEMRERGKAFVHADGFFVEGAPDLGGDVRHEVAADLAAGVGEAGVEQQAGSFDGSGAEEDGFAALRHARGSRRGRRRR